MYSSFKPQLFFFRIIFNPSSGKFQIQIWFMWLVIQVHSPPGLFWYCPLDLCAFVPFVERINGDNLRLHIECRQQAGFIVSTIHSVACVVIVPWSYTRIYISGSYTRNKQQLVGITEGLEFFPILMRGTIGETVRSKICVHPIKPSSQDIMLVTVFYNECNDNSIMLSPTQTLGASR